MNTNCCFLSKTKLKVILWPSKDLFTNRLGAFCSAFSLDRWLLLWPEILVPMSPEATRGVSVLPVACREGRGHCSPGWCSVGKDELQPVMLACYLSGSLPSDGGKDDV